MLETEGVARYWTVFPITEMFQEKFMWPPISILIYSGIRLIQKVKSLSAGDKFQELE